ncbi:HEAT repeat domain-containing protein [Natronolimnobius sp. AArcel1]|uniref:HEAT repeat domain-containing protein n=1 Tax=Natronolimnobius sp. AArcel1 TaxID=1679093 RepID=UPI0013EA20C3|nr:HEAT repeat domain-containing protein [Natronolimnobius sp. AArcel1]NGM71170.1 HEAT repeat domain-containing protein [Natronolimnobius sp. AArcel1]
MDGDGYGGSDDDQVERDSAPFELPAILAQLDDHTPETQHAAVRTIRRHVDTYPERCIPTVPKLRTLLDRPSLEFHDEIAYCLAELADESPPDVAPSADQILAFVTNQPSHPATADLCRCLASIADDRPGALVEQIELLTAAIADRPVIDGWGIQIVSHLSTAYPTELEPAVPVLVDALEPDPTEHGVEVFAALGRIARTGTTLQTDEFVAAAASLATHENDSLRTNAIGCLADVARHHPATVEGVCPDLTPALESEYPQTRANAATTIARVAAGVDADTATSPISDQLVSLLEDEHTSVRLNACLAVGYGRIEAAREQLGALEHRDPDRGVRERAAWARAQLPTANQATDDGSHSRQSPP